MWTFEQMAEQMVKDLSSVADDEAAEFFSHGMTSMLRKQLASAQVMEVPFRRKFTALFRLYGPLARALHDNPVALISAYLLWENNYFMRIALPHHRDQARTETVPEMVELMVALQEGEKNEEQVHTRLAEMAELRLSKIKQGKVCHHPWHFTPPFLKTNTRMALLCHFRFILTCLENCRCTGQIRPTQAQGSSQEGDAARRHGRCGKAEEEEGGDGER